jgi:tRNA(fMet)-specific endonuclease VapC
MAYIIDADWIIEIGRGNSVAMQVVSDLAPEVVAVSWLTLGEIYEVAFNTPHPEAYIDSLQQLLSRFAVIGVDGPIIERFAEVRALLRRQGQLISDLDILLAATALARDLTVLTYNRRHFERVPDLRIYQAG